MTEVSVASNYTEIIMDASLSYPPLPNPGTAYNRRPIRDDRGPARLHVFYDTESGIYTSPNAEYLPSPTRATDHLYNIFDGLKTRWAYDDYFYLALVPLQPRYDLPMLDCLSPLAFKVNVVIIENRRAYQIDPDIVKRWMAWENVIVRLQRKLLRRVAGTHLLTTVPPYPSAFGYHKQWPSEEKATLAGRLARTAFTLRFAFLSYLLLKESLKGRSTWQELTQERDDPVPLCICNTLRASWVCDFTVPRVGAFIDIGGVLLPDGGRQWHEDIADFQLAGVPLWFGYAHRPVQARGSSPITLTEWKRHQPRVVAYEVLRTITTKTYKTDNDGYHDAQRLLQKEKLEDLPKEDVYGYLEYIKDDTYIITRGEVRRRKGDTTTYEIKFVEGRPSDQFLHDSGRTHSSIYTSLLFFQCRQYSGDTYQRFIERERTWIEYLKRTETGQDRERRLARESLNEGQPVPTANGPAVFVWIKDNGVHYRRRARASRIRDLWDRTTPSQRLYNSMRNEYDVDDTSNPLGNHTNFASTRIDNHNNTAVDINFRPRSASPVQRQPSTPRSRSPLTQRESLNHSANDSCALRELADALVKGADRELTIHEQRVNLDISPINTILRERYGYKPPKSGWVVEEKEAIEWKENGWVKVYRTLGHWDRTDDLRKDSISLADIDSVADFLARLKRHSTPPTELCDLHPASSLLYKDETYNRLITTARTEKVKSLSGEETTRYWYTLEAVGGVPIELRNACKISVGTATTVTHGMRTGFGTTGDAIISWLLSIGAAVRVSQPIKEPLPESPTRRTLTNIGNRAVGIGIKPHGVKLGKADYIVYMERRDELLSGPAGVAALLGGGIMWRLARNIRNPVNINPVPDVEDVSDDTRTGERVYDDRRFAEFVLSEQDTYVIAGVYRVLLEGKSSSMIDTIG